MSTSLGPQTHNDSLAETVIGDSDAPADNGEVLPVASRIGRYVIIDVLGHGGMGIVYSAYDPQLDRKIAIKVIKAAGQKGRGQTSGDRRLLREAQAMARLSHPNVIHVYDVGTSDGDVFVAMELVVGKTLADFCAPQMSWREILKVYKQAARGLAAAHDADLVHRDFKPDNVLVDENGRARVLDFGIARAPGSTEGGGQLTASELGAVELERLTMTGGLVGTPAYMSPEQFDSRQVDARTDQFAFCVALLEALEGQRPFGGDSFPTIAYAVTSGQTRPAPADSSVPPWLRDVLLRGLSVHPAERYPTMRHLLAALDHDPSRRRRTAVIIGAVVAGVGLGGVGLYAWSHASAAACRDVQDELAGVWDESRRSDVRDALAQPEIAYAEDTLANVEGLLDGFARSWVEMKTEACRATHVRGEQPPVVLDLRVRCLERRRRDLANVVDVLAGTRADTLQNAVNVASGLQPVDGCADLDALATEIEPPADPAVRKDVDARRTELDRVRTLKLAGRESDAQVLADSVVGAARRLGYQPLLAEALFWRGDMAIEQQQWELARDHLVEAVAVAEASRHDEYVASAMTSLLWTVRTEAEAPMAEVWARWARAAIERNGGDIIELSKLESSLGIYYMRSGDFERAYEHSKNGVDFKGEYDTPQNLAMSLNNLGEISRELGRYDEARTFGEHALEIRREELGSSHPHTAMSLLNLGNLELATGNNAGAEQRYTEALDIYRGALGPQSLEVAIIYNNLGGVAGRAGKTAEAIEYFEKALEIRERGLGPNSPVLLNNLANLGTMYGEQGNKTKAVKYARRAVEIGERELGRDHPKLVWPLDALADALSAAGEPQEALAYAERSVEVATEGLGLNHPARIAPLVTVGRIRIELSRHAEAVSPLREALRLYELQGEDGEDRDAARELLAQAQQ